MNKISPEARTPFVLPEGTRIRGGIARIFAAVGPEDQVEDKGGSVDYSYHNSVEGATVATRGIGASGGDGKVEPRLVLRLENVTGVTSEQVHTVLLLPADAIIIKTQEEDVAAASALRAEAIKRLSPAELAALGAKVELK
jgi:hypothetical protein